MSGGQVQLDGSATVSGEPGEGRVLVPTRLDHHGEPVEWAWVAPEAAAGWDARVWRRLDGWA